MEIENKNVGNEKDPKEELLNKREVLSEENLMEVAGGGSTYNVCMSHCQHRYSKEYEKMHLCIQKCEGK